MTKTCQISAIAVWIVTPGVKKVVRTINFRQLLRGEVSRHRARAEGCVVPEPARCVQCGICTFSCPIGIDVRRYAWKGQSISESYCLTCGECVARCPRGALSFERSNLFEPMLISDREV